MMFRSNVGSMYPTANPHTGTFKLTASAWCGSPFLPGADHRACHPLADPHTPPVIATSKEAPADFSVPGT